jgi:translation initiation factor 1A
MYQFRFHTEIKETMPNNRAQQRNRRRGSQERGRRELIYKEDGQQYAEVQKALGNGRFIMQCYDNISRIGKIRGKDYRRMWIGVGDLILISLRDFEDEKADILHKYSTEEARSLQAHGEIPATALINRTAIDIAMQDINAPQEDLLFDFDSI